VPRVTLLVGLLLTLAPIPVSGDTREEAALQKSRGATAAYNLGRFEEAARLWEEAYVLVQDPPFLYNIGQSYRQLGRTQQALHAYKSFLRTAPADAPNRDQAERRIAELERPRLDAPPTRPPDPAAAPSIGVAAAPPEPATAHTRWVLWAGVAGVAVAGAVAAVLLTRDPTKVPATDLGSGRVFR
jgi:tetratricopeptide (TPR) repeat protein